MLALLVACTTPAPLQKPGAANAFSCTGRFALVVTQAGGDQKALQGGFSWLDSETGYLLDLTNPLGAVQARVEGQADQAVLTKADGTRLEAADAETLIEQALGSKVPVAGLRAWLRGRIVPGAQMSNVVRDPRGQLVSFEQDGWQVRLSRHDTLGPRLLVLERLEADRRIMVRLVVNRA